MYLAGVQNESPLSNPIFAGLSLALGISQNLVTASVATVVESSISRASWN
jgi:hypothetical protein